MTFNHQLDASPSSPFFSFSSVILVALLSFIFTYRTYFLRMLDRITGRLPPGPTAFPILGTISIDRKRPDLTFCQWSCKYGKVFSFYLGDRLAIAVTDFNLVRKLFKDDRYSGRGTGGIGPLLDFDKGIVMSHGKLWRDHRRFSLSALRDFGFGKAAGIECIQREITSLLNFMKDQKEKPFDPKVPIANAVSNVIAFMLFSNTFQKNDKMFNMFVDAVTLNMKEVLGVGAVEIYPWLRHIMPFKKRFEGVNERVKQVNAVLLDLVKEHRKSFDSKNPRDYIDAFFCMQQDPSNTTFTDDQLVRNLGDLYIAGYETTTTFLRWALVHMIRNPKVQEKVQSEIDRNIGDSRQLEYIDKKNLPYTEATTLEVFRISSFIPFNVPHATTENLILEGYHIPKGTEIWTPTRYYFNNPDIWGDPDNFRPERFLNSDGQLNQSLADDVQPFSIGKRACLGEPLARMEAFMFFSSIFQHFTILSADKVPDLEPVVGGGNKSAHFRKWFEVK